MRYENIKTVVLSCLILISLILTWTLWTYTPTYDKMENNPSYVDDVKIGKTKMLEDHIQPSLILAHFASTHKGLLNKDMDKWTNEMKKWSISDVVRISNTSFERPEDFYDFVHGNQTMEILYPTEMSLSTFQSMYEVKGTMPSGTFDRIILKPGQADNVSQSVRIYFVNYETEEIYEANIKGFNEAAWEKHYKDIQSNGQDYIAFKREDKSVLFLPEQPTPLQQKSYKQEMISSDKFRNALFDNMKIVEENELSGQTVYNDSKRMLELSKTKPLMAYTNYEDATQSDQSVATDKEGAIKRSFDFVNAHAGWTDPYYLTEWNSDASYQSVTFQLHEDYYPVFNDDDLSKVTLKSSGQNISEYKRPTFQLGKLSDEYGKKIKLPSGKAVIKEIEGKENFDDSKLKNIIVGYELQTEKDFTNVITLKPYWFYKYDGIWYKIVDKAEQGGDKDGLE
ncbi:YycH family regulatory protein [Priestia endophytica]